MYGRERDRRRCRHHTDRDNPRINGTDLMRRTTGLALLIWLLAAWMDAPLTAGSAGARPERPRSADIQTAAPEAPAGLGDVVHLQSATASKR
jgi:hypothetical protein